MHNTHVQIYILYIYIQFSVLTFIDKYILHTQLHVYKHTYIHTNTHTHTYIRTLINVTYIGDNIQTEYK